MHMKRVFAGGKEGGGWREGGGAVGLVHGAWERGREGTQPQEEDPQQHRHTTVTTATPPSPQPQPQPHCTTL